VAAILNCAAKSESLLAAHQKAEEKFLDRPALDLAAQKLAIHADASLIGQNTGALQCAFGAGRRRNGRSIFCARHLTRPQRCTKNSCHRRYTLDAARVKRFEREARAASALNHPNIITIYEVGQIGGKHFMAAELH
jgi:serine/threonine protein kinase